MKLKFQQIGPIPEAIIDLTKKLTIFCGPNNTGKTYISYFIYALANIMIRSNSVITDEQVDILQKEGTVCVPINLYVLKEIKEKMVQIMRDIVGQIYGMPDDKATTFFEGLNVSYDETQADFEKRIIESEMSLDGVVTSTIKIRAKKISGKNEICLSSDGSFVVDNEKFHNAVLLHAMPYIYHCLALYPVTSSTIFPVERLATQVFSQELMAARLAPQNAGVLAGPIVTKDKNVRYPLAIWDSLQNASKLSSYQNTISPYADLADMLEKELLSGSLSVDNSGEAIFKANGARNKPIPIKMTASVVKSVSALTFYLRYNAVANDLVIIDEPEINLHPDSQIRLARMLSKMMNRGLRLLISTHSDYIVRELNNLIMLSSLDVDSFDKVKEEYGYSDDMKIGITDIKAYMFKRNRQNKTEVTPIDVTREGFEVTTIDDALRTLNRASEHIYYSLVEES